MPLRSVRVRHGCFLCGGDLPLERFLRGLPCEECAENRHRVYLASHPPRVVELLAGRYQQATGKPLPRVWVPWIAAVAAHESLRIVAWHGYRIVEFFALLAGTSRRPVIAVLPETEQGDFGNHPLMASKTLVHDRLPNDQEVLVTTPDNLGHLGDLRRFSGFLLWHHPEPAPEASALPGTVLVIADPEFPYPVLHGFQGWLQPGEPPPEPGARVLDPPWLETSLAGLAALDLLRVLFLLLPFLPVELQELVTSLYRQPRLDPDRAQVLREAVHQALDRVELREILEHLGLLRGLTLRVPDPEALRQQLETLDHPDQRGPVYIVAPSVPRGRYLLRRGFLPHRPPLRRRPPLQPPRDTATLLVFLGDTPALQDLGFRRLWTRRALGLEVAEGLGTLGPVTLVRIPPLFRWVERQVYPEVGLLKVLRDLARRFPRVTLMTPEPLWMQGVLTFGALAHLWNRRRLVLYSDFVGQEFQVLNEEEMLDRLQAWLQRHLLTLEHRQQLPSVEIPRAPATWVQEVSLLLLRKHLESARPRRLARITVDGQTLSLPVPEDLPGETIEQRLRQESTVQVEETEVEVPPPPPASPGRLLQQEATSNLKGLLDALLALWRAGLISHPYRAAPLSRYAEVAEVLLAERDLATPQPLSTETRGLVPVRPFLDLDLRALAVRFRVPPSAIPVYRRILLHFLAQFLPPARVQATRIRLHTPFGTAEHLRAQKILEVGFTALLPLNLDFGVVYPDLQITRIRFTTESPAGLPLADFVDHWFFHPRENPSPLWLLRNLEPWVRLHEGDLVLTPDGWNLVRRLPDELVES